MATAAQIDANRLNSQKSTGPRSDEGKAASKFNALKHGIHAAASNVLPFEDAAQRQAIVHDYYARFGPVSQAEHFLVEAMIDAHWTRLRFMAIETQTMNQMLSDMEPDTEYPLAHLFNPNNPGARQLERVVRHREAAQRAWHRAFHELLKVIKARQSLEALDAQFAPTQMPERTQSQPPLPTVPRPEPLENLALRL